MKLIDPSGKTNLHTHTCYCDGKDTPRQLAERALELGFTTLGFSGHEYTSFDPDFCMSKENTEKYRREVLTLKEEFAGKLEILLGVERDYFSDASDYPYDYVIGSVHYVMQSNEYLCIDDTVEKTDAICRRYFGGDYRELIKAYYSLVGNVTEVANCDIVGHFDLITKFNEGNALFDEEASWYRDLALEALNKVAKADPIIEINTGAMAKGYRSRSYPADFIIEEGEKLGLRFILSSDCHDRTRLDHMFSSFI